MRQPRELAESAGRCRNRSLLTWYDNWKYDASAGVIEWYGNAGTCDSSGYVVDLDATNFTNWRNRISSFTVHGRLSGSTGSG